MKRLFTNSLNIFLSIIAICVLSHACTSDNTGMPDEEYKKYFSSKLFPVWQNEDSLRLILQECIVQGDEVGAMLTYSQLGKYQRENARFSDAIVSHQESLDLALKLRDTIEIVQGYNNLGTDFRRIGVLSEASNYHYQALNYAEAYSKADEVGMGMKNKVISLNGLGNISLMLGYYDEAERYFRNALRDEIKLSSPIGQAINYANIGTIFEHRRQYDSARIYYEYSLEQNKLANSDMGIGLCHIHFGDIYTAEKKYELAKAEYVKALTLMQHISDLWHWLEAGLAIAEINLLTNDIPEFEKYIRLAEQTAEDIKSLKHLAKIYKLKHDYYLQRNDYASAMNNYKRSVIMSDSIQGVQKGNIYLDMRVNYERDRNERQIARIEAGAKAREGRRKLTTYILFGIILISGCIMGLLYYAYKQRNRSNKILKEMERMRSDFFTNITHELRTPLTVILGLNRQIEHNNGITEKEKKVFHKAIDRQSNNLLSMVNQLLNIAKVGRGTDNPEWRHGDMVPYLRMAAETFQLYAKANDLDLIFFTDLETQHMDFIPFYVDRIVSNLLSNAIKHSKPGDKIHLIFTEGKSRDTAILRVTDTGEGIPPEDIERIFEMFYQSSHSENVIGTGIGLSFVQLMVKRMGGKVEVDSRLGKGSTFTVTLPVKNPKLPFIAPLELTEVSKKHFWTENIDLQVTDEEDIVVAEDEKEDEMNTHPVLLIVEDSKDVAMYVKSLLKDDYQILTARNGEDGFEMAENNIPDLVITDIMMPVKDGYQLCCEMQKSILLNHVPIIMLTAKVTEEDKVRGLRCGVHAYLQKPFHPEELLLLISNILNSRKQLKEKYMNVMANKVKDDKLNSDENIVFLQAITDKVYSEIDNPDLSISVLADSMAISVSQLNRKMKGITDLSTGAYVLKVRLNKARKMLIETDSKISEVSDACGFYDASYFARVFKKEFGFTPSQFQRMPGNVAVNY